MARHVTYRGTTVDMTTLVRENEKATALGNMGVNARGDKIEHGRITKTADQLARENHRVVTAVMTTGIKGPSPDVSGLQLDTPKPTKAAKTKQKEVELPSGDIVVGKNSDE